MHLVPVAGLITSVPTIQPILERWRWRRFDHHRHGTTGVNARRCWIVPNSRPLTPMGEGLIPREKPRAALAHQPSDLQSAQPRRLQFRAEEIPKIVVSPLMVRGYGVRAGPARRKSFNTNRLRQFFRANNVPKVFYLFLGKSAKIPEYARGTPKKCSYIYRGQL